MTVEPAPYLTQLGMRAIGARAGVEPLTIPWISAWPGDAPAIPPHRPTPLEHDPRGDHDRGSPLVEAGGDSVGQAQMVASGQTPQSDTGSLRRPPVTASPAAAERMGSARSERGARVVRTEVSPVTRQVDAPGLRASGRERADGPIDAASARGRKAPTTRTTVEPAETHGTDRDGARGPRGSLRSQASPPGARDAIQPVVTSAARGVAAADPRRGRAVRRAATDAPSATTGDSASAALADAPSARVAACFLATISRGEPPPPARSARAAGGDRHASAAHAGLGHDPSPCDASGNRGTPGQEGSAARANRTAGEASAHEASPARLPEPTTPRPFASAGSVATADSFEHEVRHARRIAAAPPVVRVRIGRIEIRAESPAPQRPPRRASAPVQPARPRAPAMSLADYLKRRDGGALWTTTSPSPPSPRRCTAHSSPR